MIDNEYIKEINIDLDYKYIYNLVKKHQSLSIEGMAAHHRRVSDDSYMSSILAQYPCLSHTYNIYTMSSGGGLPIHIDARRKSAFNIPISGTDNSHTIFYEPVNELEFYFDEQRIYNVVTSDVNEVFRFTMNKPVLINNTVPHKVEVNGTDDRLILSWSIDPKYNFEDAKQFFKSI